MSDEFGGLLNELHDDLPRASRQADAVKRSVLEGHARRVRHRRLRSVAVVSIGCAVAVAGLVAVAQTAGRDEPLIRTDQSTAPDNDALQDDEPLTSDLTPTAPPSVTPDESGQSPWRQMIPDPPLEERAAELVVSMGDSVFVWGGFVPNHQDGSEPPFSDGAIGDLEDGTWRPVAQVPLSSGFASGVWTGSEVVVSNAGLIAAYDPTTDSWRTLTPPAPLGPETQHLGSLSDDVVLPLAGYVWNPANDNWRDIAAMPDVLSAPRIDQYDEDLIVSGASRTSPTGAMAFRYDAEADIWIELPAPDIQVYEGAATGVVGDDLVVVSWASMRATALDLATLQWRDLPTFPQFTVKCLANLEPVADSIIVVSMCGQHAALTPGADKWVAFDPPTTSSTFGLHSVNGGLLIDGSVLATASDDWIRSPQLGRVSAAGATIDRSVQPEVVVTAPTASIGLSQVAALTVEMTAIECVLVVSNGDPVEQRTVSAAREQSRSAPDAVDFLNQFGSYSLSCPSGDAYVEAFGALTVRGERGESQDSLLLFSPPLLATETPEDMVNAIADFVAAADAALGRDSSIGLYGPIGDPVTVVIDSYYDDGATQGSTYTVTLNETEAGWIIVDATVQAICTRRSTEDASDQACT